MTTPTALTLDQFLALPETEPASEYICGQVQRKPMPNHQHSGLQTDLGARIMYHARSAKLGYTGSELRCVFGPPDNERALVPDISFIRRERRLTDPQAQRGTFYGAPDLAVEIVSPDQSARAFADKITFYLQYGVRLVWVVDPDAREITVFAAGSPSVTVREGDTLNGGEVLPGFILDVSDLFSYLDE